MTVSRTSPLTLCLSRVFRDNGPAHADNVVNSIMGRHDTSAQHDDDVIHSLMKSRRLGRRHYDYEAHDDAVINVLMQELSPRTCIADLHPEVLVDRASWAFVGPLAPWRGAGMEEEDLIQNLTSFQCSNSSAQSAKSGALSDIMSAWGNGGEMFLLESFIRAGGFAVVAVDSTSYNDWRHKHMSCGSKRQQHLPSASRLSIDVPTNAMLQAIAAAVSGDMILLEDVVLCNGTLRRGWQLLEGPHGAIRWEDTSNLKTPTTLIFDTSPGLIAVKSKPWAQPLVHLGIDSQVEARLSQFFSRPQSDCLDVEWPPPIGVGVRRRCTNSTSCNDKVLELGKVVGNHRVAEGRRVVEKVGWVDVRWDTGVTEALHVHDLQLGDDTYDFLRRVFAHYAKRGSSMGLAKARSVIANEHSNRHWQYLAIQGFNSESGSFVAYDPTIEDQPEVTLPLRVLRSCAEVGGKMIAALLVYHKSSRASYGVPRAAPVQGELRVGDMVLVEADSLFEAGFHDGIIARRHKLMRPRPVPARVVSLTGLKEIGVSVDRSGKIYWVQGSDIQHTSPLDAACGSSHWNVSHASHGSAVAHSSSHCSRHARSASATCQRRPTTADAIRRARV
mmetsp:Transcript_121616/g.192531  ORF Transcript_121616/g.192531 Transcript_121616/m.192531 type:complete len:613 (+) Transcript_121616:13-1851(+)